MVHGENICPSRKYVRNLVIEKLRIRWDDQWREYPKARQSKIFYSNQDPKRAKEACRPSRKKLSRLICIISGHNGLLYHRHNIENSIDPTCRYCEQENEKISHFLLYCPTFDGERQDIFGDPVIAGTMDWKIKELLDFSFLPRANDALAWKSNTENPERAEVVIHPFSDSDTDVDDQVEEQLSQASFATDSDSDDNDEELLDTEIDPVFQ